MKMRGLWMVLGVSAVLLVPASGAFAQGRGKGGGGGGRGGGGGGGGGMQQPTVNTALVADRQAVKDAGDASSKASQAYTDALKKFTDDFQKQPEYADAQKAMTDAQKEVEDTRTAAIAKLKDSNPDYKAAAAKEKAAQAKVDQLRASGGSRDAMLTATTAVLSAGDGVSKMEADALAKDEPYTTAKKKLTDATAALKVEKDKLAEAVKGDANLTTLKESKDTADTALVDARKKLAADGG